VTERVLSTRELNRALLARQLLLERSSLPLPEALEQVAGLQAQYAPSPYVGLWSRLRDFRREDLTRALEDRRAVQATLLRGTIHVVSAADYPPFAEAVRGARREWWARVTRRELEGVDMEAAAALVRERLRTGPARQAELAGLLAERGFPKAVWIGVGLWVDMVRVPPSGTWERRRADLYGLAEDWLGPWRVGEAGALEHLVRRYLAGFGPASPADLGSWAGLPLIPLRPVLERVGTCRFRDEQGTELFDLPGAPLPEESTPAPPRFLATWDATCWCTPGAPRSCPSGTGPASSTSGPRTRSRPSWSTGRWPGPGATRTAGCGWSRSSRSTPRPAGSSRTRPTAWPPSTRGKSPAAADLALPAGP
jgi:DNA glycosylase AlkZ-like